MFSRSEATGLARNSRASTAAATETVRCPGHSASADASHTSRASLLALPAVPLSEDETPLSVRNSPDAPDGGEDS